MLEVGAKLEKFVIDQCLAVWDWLLQGLWFGFLGCCYRLWVRVQFLYTVWPLSVYSVSQTPPQSRSGDLPSLDPARYSLLLLLPSALSGSTGPRKSGCHLIGLFFFQATSCSLWDVSSLTRDWTCALAVKVQSSNHWTTRELLALTVFWCVFFFLSSLGPSVLFIID